MKKTLFIIILTAILSLSACSPFKTDGNETAASRIEELETKIAEYEKKLRDSEGYGTRLEEYADLIEEYTSLIESYQNQLQAAESTAAGQNDRIVEKNNEIADLKNQLADVERRMKSIEGFCWEIREPLPNNSAILTLKKTIGVGAYMTIKYPGKDEKEIYEGGITYFAVSPDSKKLVLDDYLPEERYTCYAIIDLETYETKFNYLYGLPNGESAAYLEWLDGRYFLFVSHRNSGMNLRGGDVYVYDTETDKYQPLVLLSGQSLQVVDMKTYPGAFVAFRALKYDETKTHTDEEYYTLTVDEIHELIKSGKTVDLCKKNPL